MLNTMWMSALGQKRTCAAHKLMSAITPIATEKADIIGPSGSATTFLDKPSPRVTENPAERRHAIPRRSGTHKCSVHKTRLPRSLGVGASLLPRRRAGSQLLSAERLWIDARLRRQAQSDRQRDHGLDGLALNRKPR